MSIFYIPKNLDIDDYKDWDINDEVISKFETIENYENHIKELRSSSKYLKSLPIKLILNFFDSLSIHWLTDENSKFLNYFSQLGVSFLINFFKRNNLEQFFKESLHGNIHCLDDFINTVEFFKNNSSHKNQKNKLRYKWDNIASLLLKRINEA